MLQRDFESEDLKKKTHILGIGIQTIKNCTSPEIWVPRPVISAQVY